MAATKKKDDDAKAVKTADAPEVLEPADAGDDSSSDAWWNQEVNDPEVQRDNAEEIVYPHGEQPDPPDEKALQKQREKAAAEVAPPSLS